MPQKKGKDGKFMSLKEQLKEKDEYLSSVLEDSKKLGKEVDNQVTRAIIEWNAPEEIKVTHDFVDGDFTTFTIKVLVIIFLFISALYVGFRLIP